MMNIKNSLKQNKTCYSYKNIESKKVKDMKIKTSVQTFSCKLTIYDFLVSF